MKIVYLLFLALFGFQMFSTTKTFTLPENFSDPSKWNLGALPTTGDNLVYGTLKLPTVITCNKLNINTLSLTISTAAAAIISFVAIIFS